LISDPYRETAAFGAPIEFVTEGVPRCRTHIVRSMEDVLSLGRPDVYRAERTRDRILGVEMYQRALKGDVPLYGWIEGPLAEACDLAGVDAMLTNLLTEPEFAERLMDKCIVTAKDFARAQVEAGCDVIGIGDAICSQIRLSTYDKFVKARHKDLVEYIHAIGAKVKLHICGNITHLMPSIKDLDLDILDFDYMVDMESTRGILRPEEIRCGNINPVDIQFKPAAEVAAATKALVEKERGRRFILSGGCEITVDTPPANLTAMREAAR